MNAESLPRLSPAGVQSLEQGPRVAYLPPVHENLREGVRLAEHVCLGEAARRQDGQRHLMGGTGVVRFGGAAGDTCEQLRESQSIGRYQQ